VFYVYVLWSKKDKKLYTGWTENYNERLKEHNFGLVPATRPRRPLKLVFFEAFINKKDAVLREKFLKTGWGRRHLSKCLKNTIESLSGVGLKK